MGIASRREAEKWISEGRVSINGEITCLLGAQIDPDNDRIAIDGKPLDPGKKPSHVYWVFHKPDLYLTSTKGEPDKPTIYDLPKLKGLGFRVLSAGRLDYRTEGLLVLSNDGEFIHRLTHPSYKMPRHYYALVNGKLTAEQMKQIKTGLPLEDGVTQPADIQFAHGKNLGGGKGSWYIITVYEGRNRLVRRTFSYFGLKTVRLVRFGMGNVRLPEDLKPGEYRQMSSSMLTALKKDLQLVP